jgi:hypothetical protein
MFLMFALFVVSLCTLLWAAFSVARHIRRDKQLRQTGPLAADPLKTDGRPPQHSSPESGTPEFESPDHDIPELTGLNPRSGE